MAEDRHQQHRRTGHAVLPAHRVPWRQDLKHRRLLFFGGVGLAVLVILGLYAASFTRQAAYQALTNKSKPSAAWQGLQTDLERQGKNIQQELDRLGRLRESFSAAATARNVRAQGLELLKSKIHSASATPSR